MLSVELCAVAKYALIAPLWLFTGGACGFATAQPPRLVCDLTVGVVLHAGMAHQPYREPLPLGRSKGDQDTESDS